MESQPAPVELIELDAVRRYDIDQLIDGLDDPPGPPTRDPVRGPRTGRTEIDRLLLAIPTTEYVRAIAGVSPNRAGKVHCPFHDDTDPSLHLYDDGTFYCFGCQAGGSIYDFAARLWHTSTKGREFLQLRDRLLAEMRP